MAQTDSTLLINPYLCSTSAAFTLHMLAFTRCMTDFPLAASDHSLLSTCGQKQAKTCYEPK